MFKSLKRKAPAEKVIYCFVSLIFLLFALSYIYIIAWTLMSSLKTHTEIVLDPFSLPKVLNWSSYLELPEVFYVNNNGFGQMLFNSVWFSVVGAFLQQFVTIAFAYCCSKYKFPGSEWIYTIVLIMTTLPIYGTGGATYRLYHELGLINTYAHVLASCAGFNIHFLYYRAYFKNLSWTYAEAAMMDGANHFQIYSKVMLPQAKPLFFSLFLTTWLASWNNWSSVLLYLPKLPTLPVGIQQFNVEMIYKARLDVLFAACMIVAIPALVMFIAFNKVLTTSVSVGGIKG